MNKYIVRITFKDNTISYPITRRMAKELTTNIDNSYIFTKAQTKAIIDDIKANIEMGEECLARPPFYQFERGYLESTVDNKVVDKRDIEKIEIVKVKLIIQIDE